MALMPLALSSSRRSRTGRFVRAADRPEVPTPLRGLRRRAGMSVRDTQAHLARAVRGRGRPRPDLKGHRRRARRRARVAGPAARGPLPDPLPRCADRESQRRRRRPQQGPLRRDRRQTSRAAGRARLWFQSSEGAKFWLAVLNELKAARRPRRADLLRRRPQRLSGSDRGDPGST
jgi:hypothetical protein